MSAAPVEDVEVDDLDPVGVLDLARDLDHEARRIDALKLRAAAHWADLHPATTDTGTATLHGDLLTPEETLGGDGTPAVAAFTPEALAAALGTSPAAGTQLIADALDLRHRLPALWKRVHALIVPAWQARRVAQQTHRLPQAGARWVDDQLAARTDAACGPVITDRLVAHAAAEFDPETHQQREEDATTGWDVVLSHPQPAEFTGTSHLTADGDTLTLAEFHTLVCEIAHRLLLDGDTSPLGVRKIKAIRIITRTVQGHGTLETATVAGKVQVHLHLDAADLDLDAAVDTPDGSALATGQVEKLGAATLARIRDWVGHHPVVIRPVLNLQRRDAVDQHDPPPWMRELVILRDGHCVFPGCTRDARSCDLDHEIPYDPDGPSGQTRPDNLAALCRRHHRAKTAGVWRYIRTPEGGYLWHGPHGTTYLVTDGGTAPLR